MGVRRGWLLKVSHFELDAKSMRERNNAQAGVAQSPLSPRHYGNPLLVRVSADETVGVRFSFRRILRQFTLSSWRSQHARQAVQDVACAFAWVFTHCVLA